MGAGHDAERASRIYIVRPNTSIVDAAAREAEIRDWVVRRLLRLKSVLGPKLKAILGSTLVPTANGGVGEP